VKKSIAKIKTVQTQKQEG